MSIEPQHKVTAQHLARKAFVYVRQSTVRQVFENTESTKRQYALRETAIAMGWPPDQIVVIDTDLGQSGASKDREGFQKLVAEVGLGHAGIVLSLEVSRLARNSIDWHQLLEICAMTDTLIVDEGGVYDPSQFNDRLLLGLKGTMSEAELHVMRARLRGGLLNKARRGELECALPVGFVYNDQRRIVLDPDQQVQDSVRLIFRTFVRTGTAHATACDFQKRGLNFPARVHGGAQHGELVWRPLSAQRAVSVLRNPRYAGAFAFGRRQSPRRALGHAASHSMPRDQWLALVLDVHPGYITWAEHEAHGARLSETARAFGADNRHGTAREGPALLQGMLVCGVCGLRMNVSYKHHRGKLIPKYSCWQRDVRPVVSTCTFLAGATLDAAIAELIVDAVTPMAVEVALAVEQEIRARFEQTDRLRLQTVERVRYEADLARRRFLKVDPDNRLVASTLEAAWNEALRVLAEAEETLEQQRRDERTVRDPAERERMLALTRDFPALWRDPSTPARERKRMLGLLVEDVTVHKGEHITLHLRFRGGATTTRTLPRPLRNWELCKTDAAVVAEIDALLAEHTYAEVTAILNDRGRRSGSGRSFNTTMVKMIVAAYKLKTLERRLLDANMINAPRLAERLGVCMETIYKWQREGRIDGRRCNGRDERMYDPATQPTDPAPTHTVTPPMNATVAAVGQSTRGGAV